METHSKKKSFFITGITGFTGIHLEKYLLNEGFEVYGSTYTKPKDERHFYCDILSEDSIYDLLSRVKPNFIVHLAAVSFVASKDQLNIYNVNVLGTLNLLNAIERLDYTPQKIVIASSAAVYGNIEGELTEDICPKPVNHYGNSKLVMENMTLKYFENQNIIITRPFNYTGIHQANHFLIPKIVSHYKQKKKEIDLGNIAVYREFNEVNFVVKCYAKLALSEVKSEIINVCTGTTLSIKDILDILNDLSGYEIIVNINPKFVRKNEIQILKGSPNKMYSIIGDFSDDYGIKQILSEMLTLVD